MNDLQLISETPTHKVETAAGAIIRGTKESLERDWRDAELSRTDLLSLLTDHPKKGMMIAYRNSLRSYPNQPDFPNGARPTLD